jgi:hypothetical protein
MLQSSTCHDFVGYAISFAFEMIVGRSDTQS